MLVTLVRVAGSSYRKPGARLFTVNGEVAGSISGGCLDTEVKLQASWIARDGATVRRYATSFEDTSETPYGLGCGGTLDLLFEPAGTPECEAMLTALKNSLLGSTVRVITFLPGLNRPMQRAILSAHGEVIFRSDALSFEEIERALAGTRHEAFVESLLPPQRLVVLGAGDDAKPLVRLASLIGWSVIVLDGRRQLARSERFPEAQRVEAVTAEQRDVAGITPEDAVVVMTHSFEQDRQWLAAVLPLSPRYLGILGASHRSRLLVHEVSAATGLSVDQCCQRIYAPVGLDLGGEGPEAIALAVVAEAQACCTGRHAHSRRLSVAEVYALDPVGPAEYLTAHCPLPMSAD